MSDSAQAPASPSAVVGDGALSPLPWRLSPEVHKRIIFAADGYAVADTTVYHAKHGDEPKSVMEANAAFIVRAVNSHDALVEALRAVDAMFSEPRKYNSRTIAAKVRAALAKVRGEQS